MASIWHTLFDRITPLVSTILRIPDMQAYISLASSNGVASQQNDIPMHSAAGERSLFSKLYSGDVPKQMENDRRL